MNGGQTMKLKPMTVIEALQRTTYTAVYGALGSPIASSVLSIAYWRAAAAAGITAGVNLVARSCQAWLTRHPETALDSPVHIPLPVPPMPAGPPAH